MRIFLRDVFEGKPDEYADGYRRGEEGYHHPDGTPYIARTASGVYADEQREQHDAYHIVDYGGGNDGHPDFRVEFAELFERGDGDAHRRGGEYGAVEKAGNQVGLRKRGKPAAVKHSARGEKAEEQGKRDAHNGDDDAGHPNLFELFEVGVQPRGKHNEYDADFCEERKPFRSGRSEHVLSGDVLDAAEHNARDYHTDHLRQSEFFADYGKEFCNDQYESERQKQFVDVHIILRVSDFLSISVYVIHLRAGQVKHMRERGGMFPSADGGERAKPTLPRRAGSGVGRRRKGGVGRV